MGCAPIRDRFHPTFLLWVLTLGGCATDGSTPVVERAPPGANSAPVPSARPVPIPARAPDSRPRFHVVRKGETLYGIASSAGLDYREVAQWNDLDDLGRIRAGQHLRLTPPGDEPQAGVVVTPLKGPDGVNPTAATQNRKTEPEAVKLPNSEPALAQLPKPSGEARVAPEAAALPSGGSAQTAAAAPGDEENLGWRWPTTGKVIAPFTEASKGVDIAGSMGQPVVASAGGKVVYSGNSLRGYGKLIIIKHNKTYLSAYAHNSQLLVKEGQTVAKGQKIAEMGNTDTDRVKLHFEIRRFGKPVDPMKFLPSEKLS